MATSEVRVASVEDLASFLLSAGIDVASYGTGQYKSVFELYQEIVNNETRLMLTEQGVVRCVAVAVAKISNCIDKNKILYEAKQEWPSISRVRCRNILPAGKMTYGDSYEDSIVRELREELGSALAPNSNIEVDLSSIVITKTCEISRSYPGLTTEYTTYTGQVTVTDLPSGNFVTEEETGSNGTLIASWEWRDCAHHS